jgi:hypothetical protein
MGRDACAAARAYSSRGLARLGSEHPPDTLIERLRREAVVHAEDFASLPQRLAAAENELEDLRAVRDALTPPELPERPGLELAATFVPASATPMA